MGCVTPRWFTKSVLLCIIVCAIIKLTKIRTRPARTSLLVFLLEESNAKKTRHTVQAPGLRKACSLRHQVLRGACSAAHPGREDNTGERVRHALAERVPGISSCESTVRSVPEGRTVRQGDRCRPYRAAPGRFRALLGQEQLAAAL